MGSVDQGLPLAAFTKNVYRIVKTSVLTLQRYRFLPILPNFCVFFFTQKGEMPSRQNKTKKEKAELQAVNWKSRACLTPEGKATVTPENFFILTPVKS